MEMHTAFIGVGSNLGNKRLNCRNGIDALTKSGTAVLKDQSRFYKTEPVDYEDQDWFVNAVVKIETPLDPFELLKTLKSIELRAGRIRNPIRFGPRILDLDIIFYDDLVIKTSQFEIPHPRMHKRHFVLKPICDIDPTVVHSVFKKDVRHLLDDLVDHLGEDGQKVVEYPCDC
ncbi:MAG: 2-amino-4-hydroxy-6-hydroxymethyldihydropteridine diphosphokinase [Desulfobacterales bacterium]|uniref:2-amino-4-hydroxy-6-hydroxymethyldihydropteridine pyrophosphokinase n=1 Tax=Candidatus Desulfatibia profunda TaxID=2841695 RepID=A0A8J6NWT1_9BACT|nr:2-amino-4-hydroxy-6-hydroxymethyldihydropteridine diphosphokinase [Candidatus Desulfatibia profunda]MBL7180756.1 2-amino-4-hydroxy-6-hydroxymethyldihydropteridine diphosphokinase [Desulfobacterales bacterium]